MNRNLLYLFTVTISLLATTQTALAVCPLCAVAVGAGIGLAQWLGVDDTISGLWVGGLVVALILWTIAWMTKKNYFLNNDSSKGRIVVITLLVAVTYYLLFVAPLYWYGIIGHLLNKLWGIDKLLLGIVCGSVAFWVGAEWYVYLKKNNNNRAYFPFQKVVIPVVFLLALSVFFYFLTK